MSDPFADPSRDPQAITRRFKTRCYGVHLQDPRGPIDLARGGEHVHASDSHALAGVLGPFCSDLGRHMRKIRRRLFPSIQQGGMVGLKAPLAMLREVHAGHDRNMAQFRDLTPPPDVRRRWTAVHGLHGVILRPRTDHFRIESDLLFPQVARRSMFDTATASRPAAELAPHLCPTCHNHV